MNKTFLIHGEMKEYTDEELVELLLNKQPDEKLPSSLLDGIIACSIASIQAFARAEFNTARDANAMIAASKMLSEQLVQAVKQRTSSHIDQLIAERLELAPPKQEVRL